MSVIMERFAHYRESSRRPELRLLAQSIGRTAAVAFVLWGAFRVFPSLFPPPYLVGVWTSWLIVGIIYGLSRIGQGVWLVFRANHPPGSVLGGGVALLCLSFSSWHPIVHAVSSVHMMINGGGVLALVVGSLCGMAIQEASYLAMSALINSAWHGLQSVLALRHASVRQQ